MNTESITIRVIQLVDEVARVTWTTPRGVTDSYDTKDVEEAKEMARHMSKAPRIAKGWKVILKKVEVDSYCKRAPGQDNDYLDYVEEDIAEMQAAIGSDEDLKAYYAPNPVPTITYVVVGREVTPLKMKAAS